MSQRVTDTVDPEMEPAAPVGESVTLVEGSTFAISGRSGDMSSGGSEGLFFRDVRLLSTWRLRLDDEPLQPLAVLGHDPFHATFLSRVPPRSSSTDLLVERRRYVGGGMREDLKLRNLGAQPLRTVMTVEVDCDFADLFAVKEGRSHHRPSESADSDGNDTLLYNFSAGPHAIGVRISSTAASRTADDTFVFDVFLAPKSDWTTTVMVTPVVESEVLQPSFPADRALEESPPWQRLRRWRASSPTVVIGDLQLRHTLRQSMEDLGALRMFDPEHPQAAAVAAGAPWFMALFGRDSLLSSYMALPLDPSLALGTLQTLAGKQGSKVDERTEEQPGRILHETRLGAEFPLSHGGGSVYYGTADATPLFVTLLGELRRWSIAAEEVHALLCGTPVVARPVGAAREIVADGKTGFLRETVDGLADALARVTDISPYSCRERVSENFSADAMVDSYERLYKEMAAL